VSLRLILATDRRIVRRLRAAGAITPRTRSSFIRQASSATHACGAGYPRRRSNHGEGGEVVEAIETTDS